MDSVPELSFPLFVSVAAFFSICYRKDLVSVDQCDDKKLWDYWHALVYKRLL